MGARSKKDREALVAEASAWLAALDSGSADRRAFEAWRDEDAARAAAFAEVADTWGRLDALLGGAAAEPRTARKPEVQPERRWLLRAAGLGGVALLGGGLFAGQRAFARNYVETGVGERRAVALPDGSRVELNTDTAVYWRVGRELSHVWLERGQAALSVAEAPRRGFLLSARGAEARLTPGQFDARLRGDSLDLVVLSGAEEASPHAAVSGERRPARLTIAGDKVTRQAMTDADISAATSWRRGEIVFDGAPLSAVVDEYNRYLTRKLVIADPNVANIKLGGRFLTSNPDGFLLALQQAFGVQAVADSDRILLVAEKNRPTA